jgi:hypothetical protein
MGFLCPERSELLDGKSIVTSAQPSFRSQPEGILFGSSSNNQHLIIHLAAGLDGMLIPHLRKALADVRHFSETTKNHIK